MCLSGVLPSKTPVYRSLAKIKTLHTLQISSECHCLMWKTTTIVIIRQCCFDICKVCRAFILVRDLYTGWVRHLAINTPQE